MKIGTEVRTRKHNGNQDYAVEVRLLRAEARVWGVHGIIRDISDAHGETFFVKLQTGDRCWFDRDELEGL